MSRIRELFAHLRSSVAASLVLALIVTLSTFAYTQSPVVAQQGGLDPAPDPRVAGIEKDFLMGMIPHHRGAIMMAQMALQKASRPEVRELAQTIIASQQVEIELMTNYLRDWYGMTPPEGNMMPPEIMARMDMPMMRGLMPDMQARMKALESKSGAAFDVEFMSAMTDHHAMAIMMASPVLIAGYHRDLYPLASNIVISQGEEIKQMRDYLERFYGYVRPMSIRQ